VKEYGRRTFPKANTVKYDRRIKYNNRHSRSFLFIFALGLGKPESRGGGFIGKMYVPEASALAFAFTGRWGSFQLLVFYSTIRPLTRFWAKYAPPGLTWFGRGGYTVIILFAPGGAPERSGPTRAV
jgi:hypothetical protein